MHALAIERGPRGSSEWAVYLGLDIGTTATKAILIDEAQKVRGRSQAAYPTSRPRPGFAEQSPALWIEAVTRALDDIRDGVPDLLGSVRCIGLSGQMHTLVTLGHDDAPNGPALLWNDVRGAQECRLLTEQVPDIAMLTGVVPTPSFTAAKLLWVKRNDPRRFAATRRVLLPKDYVRLWLTGGFATDMSDAAGAQLLDGARRSWAVPVLEAIGVPRECLPSLVEGTAIVGELRDGIAERLGLPRGTPVAAGGGDAAVGAVGLGCLRPGDAYLSLGTGTMIVVATDRFAPSADDALHTFAHAVPGLWYRMAAMLNGASCLAWAARLVGEEDIASLLRRVEDRHQGPSGTVFLPYLAGERTPHNDADLRACFLGFDPASDAVDLAQSVLEGVAFAIRDGYRALESAGVTMDGLGFAGGGTRSRFWGGLIATILGRPLLQYEDAEVGPAFGAARLGMMAAGAASSDCATPPRVMAELKPDPRHVSAYRDRHDRFRAAAEMVKALRLGSAPS